MNLKLTKRVLRRKTFHLFTLTASLFCLFITASFSDPGAPKPSVLWYASSLHWSFWLGLALSALAIVLSIANRRKYLALASILLPVLYLHSLPPLIHDMPPVFDVYHVIPSVLSIVQSGTWDPQHIPFPSSHVYQAASVMILNLKIMTYVRIFPTILTFSISLFLFTIARRISKRWAPAAPLIFLALNWYMEYHLARQPFTLMLWTVFWLALFLYMDGGIYRMGLAAGIILFALVPSHPGMLIIVSFNLFVLSLVTIFSLRDREEWRYFKPFIPILVIFATAAALFYNYVPAMQEYMTSVYEEFTQSAKTTGFSLDLGGPSGSSFQYEFVNQLRMLTGAFYSLLAVLGFAFLYKKTSKRALLLGAWFFSIFLWLVYPLTQEGLYMERAFLSALIPASVLTVALLKHCWPDNLELRRLTRVSTVVVIIALLLTIPITKSSIDTIETPSRSSYRAGLHAEQQFDQRVYTTDTHEGLFRYIESETSEDHSTTGQFRARGKMPPDQPYGYPIPRTDRHVSPIIFTDHFNNYLEVRYGNTTAVKQIQSYEMEISEDSARVYDSGGARIYIQA
ncbi:MAG: hypothetical protein ACLFSM_00935 [Thermoplasmata archaeon]